MPTDINVPASTMFSRQQSARVASSVKVNIVPAISSTQRAQHVDAAQGGKLQELSAIGQKLPQETQATDKEQLQLAVQEINSLVQNLQRDLQFKVDTESGRTIISVVDSETKEVIRQLPPEDVLERAKRMDEAAKGEFPVDGLLLKIKI